MFLSGKSTVVLMLSVKHSTPTLNKVDLMCMCVFFWVSEGGRGRGDTAYAPAPGDL